MERETPPVSSQLSICSGCFCFQRHGEDSDKSGFTHQLFIDKTRTYHIRCLVGARNPGRFNTGHLAVKNFAATVSLKALRNDSLNASIRRLSFEEQCGFALQKFSMKVTANNKRLNIKDFSLELSNSALSIDSLSMRYDSLPDLPKLTDNVQYQGSVNASVVLKDIAPFVPALAKFDTPLHFNMDFSGKGKNIDCPTLRLTDNHSLMINGEASVADWNAGRNMYIMGKLTDVNLNKEGISTVMSNVAGKVPPIFQQLEYVRFSGDATGYLHDLIITGLLRTGVGTIKADVMMSIDKQQNRTYSGNIASADLNVGKLLDNEKKFGTADFNLELKGFNYKNHYPESYIKEYCLFRIQPI